MDGARLALAMAVALASTLAVTFTLAPTLAHTLTLAPTLALVLALALALAQAPVLALALVRLLSTLSRKGGRGPFSSFQKEKGGEERRVVSTSLWKRKAEGTAVSSSL